ncbi:hypothetical protein BC828DRAFT_381407 [Blastocladiella britannica]|nr:hypothetical protein BC828DRAFT_381407 [Blastocladiella britannica]
MSFGPWTTTAQLPMWIHLPFNWIAAISLSYCAISKYLDLHDHEGRFRCRDKTPMSEVAPNMIPSLVAGAANDTGTRDDGEGAPILPSPRSPSPRKPSPTLPAPSPARLTIGFIDPGRASSPRRSSAMPGGYPLSAVDEQSFLLPESKQNSWPEWWAQLGPRLPSPAALFKLYLGAHTLLYVLELSLTRMIFYYPSFASHHACAVVLFMCVRTAHTTVWPAFSYLTVLPFAVHSFYWGTLPMTSPAAADAILGLYNLTLAVASLDFYLQQGFARRMTAVCGMALVVVNYWTYCVVYEGKWCIQAPPRPGPDDNGRLPTWGAFPLHQVLGIASEPLVPMEDWAASAMEEPALTVAALWFGTVLACITMQGGRWRRQL